MPSSYARHYSKSYRTAFNNSAHRQLAVAVNSRHEIPEILRLTIKYRWCDKSDIEEYACYMLYGANK